MGPKKIFCSIFIEQIGRLVIVAAMAGALAAPPQNGEVELPLSPLEVEVIQLFVQFSRALGQPRSVAEIYGLLFISHHPLAMDVLITRLNLSKGSASQGLKYLSDLGAVRAVYVAGDRRTHYEAVAELRNLAGRFLRKEILTHFEDSEARLERILAASQKLSGDQKKHAQARVKTLRSWEKNGKRVLPFVLKILGGGK